MPYHIENIVSNSGSCSQMFITNDDAFGPKTCSHCEPNIVNLSVHQIHVNGLSLRLSLPPHLDEARGEMVTARYKHIVYLLLINSLYYCLLLYRKYETTYETTYECLG